MVETVYASPKGKFGCADKEISEALGRKDKSTDLMDRHPFDVEICRIPAGKSMCPYHTHSEQWEFYHVIAGRGTVRHADGATEVVEGDAFLFKPGEPHQLTADASVDLVVYIVADNPLSESCYYPDSKKWLVQSPEKVVFRSTPIDYFDGEE